MSTETIPPAIQNRQQKLVSIYMDNGAYSNGKMIVGSYADKHGLIEEHLSSVLAEGWRVMQIHAFGGNSETLTVRGWIVVLLERL
jgi:hypothetical protein